MYVHQMGAANYELVTTVAPPIGTNIYEEGFAGGSVDLSHVVFDADGL